LNNLSDLLNASAAVLQDQVGRWAQILQKMREGSYTTSQWLSDVVGMWDGWLSLVTVPAQLGTQSSGALPSVLLIMDGVAETVGPSATTTNVSLPPGVTLEATDLHQLGGDGVLNKKYVLPQILPDGSSVEVRLVNLGGDQGQNVAKQLPAGLYVGPLYAKELATYRPLILIYVQVQEPGSSTSPGP
jgi:hypothetical protein